MKTIALIRATVLSAFVSGGMSAAAIAQTADPHHPPGGPGDTAAQGQGLQPAQAGMDAMPMRMGDHKHMMKIVLAILDTNSDGGLSFEELSTVEKRIFDLVDANKDGKVTPEEVQVFMQE